MSPKNIPSNDGIDSLRSNNDIAPFKNILNDMYAKDISNKVKSSLQTKAKRGEYLGAVNPYGYLRTPEDKHKLIINEEVAPIVRRMFDLCNAGYGTTAISKIFNKEGILAPRDYDMKNKHEEVENGPYVPKYYWVNAVVRNMLCNEIYLGHMVNCRARSQSYRTQKKISNPKENWIVIKNTHEALVTQDTFDTAYKMLRQRFTAGSWDGTTHIFAGLIFCECGRNLVRHGTSDPKRNYLECSRYKQYGSEICTSHRMRLENLVKVVLDDINKNIRLFKEDEERAIKRVIEAKCSTEQNSIKNCKNELNKALKRQSDLDGKVKKMYEDNISGKLPDHLFTMFVSEYDTEKGNLKNRICELQDEIRKLEANKTDVSKFVETIKKYKVITELDKHIVHELIDRITISEPNTEERNPEKTIIISYKFVGAL